MSIIVPVLRINNNNCTCYAYGFGLVGDIPTIRFIFPVSDGMDRVSQRLTKFHDGSGSSYGGSLRVQIPCGWAVLEMMFTDTNSTVGGKFLFHTLQIIKHTSAKTNQREKIASGVASLLRRHD